MPSIMTSTFNIVLLANLLHLSAAFPTPFTRRDVTAFPAGTTWDILLSSGNSIGNLKTAVPDTFSVIDIDLFDTPADTITSLKESKRVICYFSAGSREGWRPDAAQFQDGDTGNTIAGGPGGEDWEDELWLNVESANVKSIMEKRVDLAKEKGCDAVDPDNVDGFGNDSGFSHSEESYISYITHLANYAHTKDLAFGLKNALDLIPSLVDTVDFAVNEQCHEYSECDAYKPFTQRNKAVFNIEYTVDACEKVEGVTLSSLKKDEGLSLNRLGGACEAQEGTPVGGSPTPTPTKGMPTIVPSSTAVPSSTTTATPKPTASATVPGYDEDDEEEVGEENEHEEDNENEEEDENEEEEEEKEEDDSLPAPKPTGRPGKGYGWGWGYQGRKHRTGGRRY